MFSRKNEQEMCRQYLHSLIGAPRMLNMRPQFGISYGNPARKIDALGNSARIGEGVINYWALNAPLAH